LDNIKATSPGIPKIPTTPAVIKLIGRLKPISCPNIFRKYNPKAPINTLKTPVHIHLTGFVLDDVLLTIIINAALQTISKTNQISLIVFHSFLGLASSQYMLRPEK
jgi:hypothetical protein